MGVIPENIELEQIAVQRAALVGGLTDELAAEVVAAIITPLQLIVLRNTIEAMTSIVIDMATEGQQAANLDGLDAQAEAVVEDHEHPHEH